MSSESGTRRLADGMPSYRLVRREDVQLADALPGRSAGLLTCRLVGGSLGSTHMALTLVSLDAGHVDARRRLRPPLWLLPTIRLAHAPAGCGHGGTRKSNTSRRVHTRSVSPAAIAGVRGR